MDKLTKLFKRLSQKEKDRLDETITNIIAGKIGTLDLKKLKGIEDTYRVRSGTFRIIFRKRSGMDDIEVLEVSRRDEHTYKNL
ncbi:MAG TPA: hypothetical protein VJA87_00270 [Candidatus Paceibacterota bacterium]